MRCVGTRRGSFSPQHTRAAVWKEGKAARSFWEPGHRESCFLSASANAWSGYVVGVFRHPGEGNRVFKTESAVYFLLRKGKIASGLM